MYKICPLMNLLNTQFVQWDVFHENLSIDEAMVKYYGHHSSKQFIRGKPVRFGYKDWMICSSTGYCYQFDTYCGAKQRSNSGSTDNLPLGSKVVLEPLQIVKHPQLPCPNENSIIKIENRGYYCYQYDEENCILLVRWKDNSIVTIITNYDDFVPLAKVKR